MRNIIDVNPAVRVFLASELGDLIQKGLYKQVGVIRTEYVREETEENFTAVIGRQVEAVIHDEALDKLYAVEQYKGLAIRAEIGDLEIIAAIREILPTLQDGDGFTYDQRVTLGIEQIGGE